MLCCSCDNMTWNFPLTFFIVMMMSCLMNLKLFCMCMHYCCIVVYSKINFHRCTIHGMFQGLYIIHYERGYYNHSIVYPDDRGLRRIWFRHIPITVNLLLACTLPASQHHMKTSFWLGLINFDFIISLCAENVSRMKIYLSGFSTIYG